MNTNERPLVLIIDDMPIMIDIMKQAIVDDYRIKVATSGKAAIKAATTTPIPDCILLDVMMPDIDGYNVCKQLRKNESSQNTPVLMVTSKHTKKAEEDSYNAGANDFIIKPIKPSFIKERIRFHLLENEETRENTDKKETVAESFFEELEILMNPHAGNTEKNMKALVDTLTEFQASSTNSGWIASLSTLLRVFTTKLTESVASDCVNEINKLLTTITDLNGFDQIQTLSSNYDNASPQDRSRIIAEFVLEAFSNPDLLRTSKPIEDHAQSIVSRATFIKENPDPIAPRPSSENDVEYRSMSLTLAKLRPTMILRKAIYCQSGTTLLPAGAKVTAQLINRLHRASKNGNGVIEPLNLWVPIRRKVK
ncbi:MAG: hypothetical protein CL693_08295 [Cellvibrionaceae bacterium]|nr:hypothetical protein [Cellvibrionaceae bacterium]|tara:strand:- start:46007 stop:47104 length:1098 start_codon:yes stop_codon:yes gene_type:complete